MPTTSPAHTGAATVRRPWPGDPDRRVSRETNCSGRSMVHFFAPDTAPRAMASAMPASFSTSVPPSMLPTETVRL